MKMALVVALLGVLAVGGSLLAVGMNANQIYLGQAQRASPEPAQSGVQDRPLPPGPYIYPFQVRYNPAEFTGKRGPVSGGQLYLSVARGETKTVTVEVIPNQLLTKSSPVQVTLSKTLTSPVGIDVSFQPAPFTVSPGQNSSFSITIHARDDAPDGFYTLQYEMTSDAFPGRRIWTFDLLVGNASLPPLDNPPKENPPP